MRRRAITLIACCLVLVAIPTLAPDDTDLAIVINEICWAGSPGNHTAEWIELFNTTDLPIDLAGWKLISSDGAPHILLQGVIQPHSNDEPTSGYFLLERDSDESVPGIVADIVYRGALTNSGETLTLINPSGQVVDTANAVVGNGSSLAWPAGSDDRIAPSVASMERLEFGRADEPSNWATFTVNDAEQTRSQVCGTPKAENSVYNVLPIAHMTITPPIPQPGLLAEFDANDSSDSNDAIASYQWDFGDGTVATGAIVSYAYAEPGEYTLTLTITDSKGGQAQLTRSLCVKHTTAPIADFSLLLEPDREVLRAGDALTFQDESSDADSDIVSWRWCFGDSAKAATQTASHFYEAPGEYIVTLRVTDTQGELGVQTQSLPIASRLPIATFTFSPEYPNQSQTVQFDASCSFDPDGEIIFYQWDFDGDGVVDTETSDPITCYEYSSGGRFTPSLCVVDSYSDAAVYEQVVDVNASPIAQFQVSSFQPFELEPVNLTNLSHDSDGAVVEWAWDFGDGTVSNETSPSHTYQQDGLMNITLTVTDDRGAIGTAIASIDVGNLPPVACLTVVESTLPTGSTFSFDASGSFDPSPQDELAQFEWSLGEADCFERETSTPILTHAFTDDGQVAVRVRVTDGDGATAVSEPLLITVTNRAPTVFQVTWTPAEPLDDETVTFMVNAADPDGEITGWTWSLDSGATDNSQEFIHTFEDDGAYSLSVQVQDNDGASSELHTVVVPIRNAAPVAHFTAVQGSACGVSSVQFDASASYDPSPTGRIVHVAWAFGDGTSCPGTSGGCTDTERWAPEHCYFEAGTYIVTLFVIDEQGAMSSTQKTILIGR